MKKIALLITTVVFAITAAGCESWGGNKCNNCCKMNKCSNCSCNMKGCKNCKKSH